MADIIGTALPDHLVGTSDSDLILGDDVSVEIVTEPTQEVPDRVLH
ncbi:hypothetical protein [Coleofasciculus sp. G2-EDA-02]